MRILIADDEQHVCDELRYIVSQCAPGSECAVCHSGTQVIKRLRDFDPELVFLDIEMPGLDGIELGQVLAKLREPPYLVYVTAYDQFAVEAFRIGAKGYVMKPFSDQDIRDHLDAARNHRDERRILREAGVAAPSEPPAYKRHVVAVKEERTFLLEVAQIAAVSSLKRQVTIQTDDDLYRYRGALSTLEAQLDPAVFLRCHRSHIVNLHKIREIKGWFNNTYLLVLRDRQHSEIPVSRNYLDQFRKAVGMRPNQA